MLQILDPLESDFVNTNHTHPEFSDKVEVWLYPGCDAARIFKHPKNMSEPLKLFKVCSLKRPFDDMLRTVYGYGWQSPGYINTFHFMLKNTNFARLHTLAEQNGARVYYIKSEEFLENYQKRYDAPYPEGVTNVDKEYNEYTVNRLRHLYYFHRHEMLRASVTFVEGIGKKLGAGQSITDKQRLYIKSLFDEYHNQEQHALTGAYQTLNRGTINELKLPF